MAKADQFYLAAETIATTIEGQDIADAYVTLCVHAASPPPTSSAAHASVSTPKATITSKPWSCCPRPIGPTPSISRSCSTSKPVPATARLRPRRRNKRVPDAQLQHWSARPGPSAEPVFPRQESRSTAGAGTGAAAPRNRPDGRRRLGGPVPPGEAPRRGRPGGRSGRRTPPEPPHGGHAPLLRRSPPPKPSARSSIGARIAKHLRRFHEQVVAYEDDLDAAFRPIDLRTIDLTPKRPATGIEQRLREVLGIAPPGEPVNFPRPPVPGRGIDGPDLGLGL
jgi:hypothetical protein